MAPFDIGEETEKNTIDEFQDGLVSKVFLQMIGAAVPTVTVAVSDPIARLNAVGEASAATSSAKCTPLHLKRYFTASSKDFGPRARARELGRGSEHDGYIRTPGGAQVFRGIPFLLGSEDAEAKSWIALTTRPTSWAKSSIEIPLEQKADFVCLAVLCDWDENEMPPLMSKTLLRKWANAWPALFWCTKTVTSVRCRFGAGLK